MTKARYMALADFQTLWTNQIKPSLPSKNDTQYNDVYIGVAAQSSTVIDSAHHYDSIVRNRPISFSNTSGYLWVVLPSSYSPIAMMGGIEVPMTLDSTTTAGEITYKIWKSRNSYTGDFNVILA